MPVALSISIFVAGNSSTKVVAISHFTIFMPNIETDCLNISLHVNVLWNRPAIYGVVVLYTV